jgi:hypothetical protein
VTLVLVLFFGGLFLIGLWLVYLAIAGPRELEDDEFEP